MPNLKLITNHVPGLTGCYIAGGALTSIYTNKEINDIDVYPKSDEAFENAIRWAYEEGLCNVAVSENAVTFANGDAPAVQIMRFGPFESAQKIFEYFDFTVCMCALDLDSCEVIMHENFLEHCSQRFLKFNPKTKYPYASAWRVEKYKKRGYTIGKFEHYKILMACAAKPIESWDDFKIQLGGCYREAVVIPEGLDFSMENMLIALDDITLQDVIMNGYSSEDEAIAALTNRDIKYFEIDGVCFIDLYDDGRFEKAPCKPRNGVLVDCPLTFYKNVSEKDGELFSAYRHSFKYPVGEYVEADSPHIFARLYEQPEVFKTSIELRVDSVDDVVYNKALDSFTLKRAYVVGKTNKE